MASEQSGQPQQAIRVTRVPLPPVNAPPPLPHAGAGEWVLSVTVEPLLTSAVPPGYGLSGLDQLTRVQTIRIPLSDEHVQAVGPILNRLEARHKVITGWELPLDDAARLQLLKAGIPGLPGIRLRTAQLVKEPPPAPPPPPNAVRRRPIVIPVLLGLLLLLATGIVLFTPQGRDLLLAAEEGWWPAFRVGLALLLIVAPLLAAFAQSVDQDLETSDGRFGCMAFGLGASLVLGGDVGLLTSSLLGDPLGLSKLVLLFGFLFLGLAVYVFFLIAMTLPAWSGAAAALVLAAVARWPAELGMALGSPLLLGLALAAWATLLAALIHWYRRTGHPEWLWFGVAAVAVVTVASHVIGRAPDWLRGVQGGAKLPSLDAAYDRLVDRQVRAGAQPVVVIVAAAGGGIKASYWVTKVLTRATDRAPGLRRRLLLGSGVSGGSLGLAFYRALLQVPGVHCEEAGAGGPLEGCAAALHRRDLLAGLVGAFGTTEVFNTVLPVFPRRSVALETGWEERWNAVVRDGAGHPAAPVMAAPFRTLWHPGGATPSLILNATRPLTGDRVVVSNLDLTGVLQPPSACGANIAQRLDMPLSTAANVSARFPIVEAWGWYRLPAQRPAGCREREAIADGGFYDNYGAATALDVYRRVKQRAAAASGPAPRIIVIQISSDVDCRLAVALDADFGRKVECDQRRADRAAELAPRPLKSFFVPSIDEQIDRQKTFSYNAGLMLRGFFYERPEDEPAPPGLLGTLGNAVATNGLAVAARLRETVEAQGDTYFHFSLGGALDIPLGWSLSRHAREEMDRHLDRGANGRAMLGLVAALAPAPAGPAVAHDFRHAASSHPAAPIRRANLPAR